MASILDLLSTHKGEVLISKVNQKTSESNDKIMAALAMGFPILLGAMNKNISSTEGKESLNNALNSEKHNPELIENLNNANPSELVDQGGKILNHILGSNQETIVSTIGSTLQMKESSIADILKMAAPVLMSILSTQKKNENIDSSGLENLINSVLGSSSKFDLSLIETFLDKNKDGSIIDDVGNMILGGGKKGKKDGGILGGMLGGK